MLKKAKIKESLYEIMMAIKEVTPKNFFIKEYSKILIHYVMQREKGFSRHKSIRILIEIFQEVKKFK